MGLNYGGNVLSLNNVYSIISSNLYGDTFFGEPANVLTNIASTQKTQGGIPANINNVNVIPEPRLFTNTEKLLYKQFETRAIWTIYIYMANQKQNDSLQTPDKTFYFSAYYRYIEFLEKFMNVLENEYNNQILVDSMGENGHEFVYEHSGNRWYGGRFQLQTKWWSECSNLIPESE